MSVRRKLAYLLPWVRRREDREMQEELDALRQFAGPHELGNLTLAGEDARAVFSWMWLERLVQDLRYAWRSMAHHKAFTALVVISLALGIGANTAIFSFMDGILIRPLPVRDPHALVIMKWRAKDYSLATSGMSWSTGGSFSEPGIGSVSSIFPYAALKVFEDAHDVVAGAFSYFSANRLSLTANDDTDSVKGQYVSGNYFAGVGIVPVAGRLIQPADDDVGRSAVAVLSHRFSQQRFGDARAAVGQTVRINDKPFAVIGVAPPAFFGAEPGAIPDVYIPMHADSILEPGFFANKYTDEHFFWIEIMARLQPGVSLAQAQNALSARFHRYAEASVTTDEQRKDLPALDVQSGATGLDSLRRQYAEPIYILMAMVALILLIACSNVANLLLARAAARRREIAIRLGLGASRGRVIRQLLTESVLLASLGGALGVAVAWWGIRVLTQLLSNGRENFTLHAELNWAVLGVTLALSVITGLLFGLAPALQATRVEVAPALKEVRASHATRRRRVGLGHTLVVAQIVFSLVLLVGAGLFGRTLAKLHAIELGFDREHVLLFTIRPAAIGYKGPALNRLFEDLRAGLSRLPGVQNVSLSQGALPMGGGTMAPFAMLGAPPPIAAGTGRPGMAAIANVGPGFFATLRIPVAGRDFTERDASGAARVAIVNHRFAAMFGVDNPIGRTITLAKDQFEIVGLAEDALIFQLKEEHKPIVYFSYLQATRPIGGMVYEIRTAGDPAALASSARQTVRRLDSRLAISDVKTQAEHIDQAISSEITLARLCAAFAGLALVIACVGLYGTVAFNVSRRTNEIGIRMTLGAQRARIVWMILREVLVMSLAGLALGIPLALIGSRQVRALLFGIEPTDPVALALGVAALVVSGMVAGFIPARRASRIDPMVAVRHE